jgi:hypothetical protein
MQETEVIEFYRSMEDCGTTIWIDGGWGVDALLGKQTRSHKDLDIAIEDKDVATLRKHLKAKGYQDIKLEVARPQNFVLGDGKGHEIDVHVIELDVLQIRCSGLIGWCQCANHVRHHSNGDTSKQRSFFARCAGICDIRSRIVTSRNF